ncbi:hypothetical protein BDN72DRAFT_966118 [Pluteus cervinus]|uniref:Uncharacterized protein n=1 Tax=Pluteus cervinus TaxID=181527 RepID=A0ACD3A1E0_9AGAR|nr:hypothetical protein BDN72DRAFT_966118 [Pluteus cervinus]
MNLSDQSTIQTQTAVFYSTINHFPSSSERASGTKLRSARDSEVRERLARYAVKSASFNATERGDPPKCHPDTRRAIQDSLVAWRSNRVAGPVRLISGWAGTGKTTIAQTMAEYWAKQCQLAGSFFFSSSSEGRSGTSHFEETILHQFLQTLGADVDVGHLGGWPAWPEVAGVLVSTSLSLLQPVVIVIDGLDECHRDFRQVSFLRQILGSLDQLGSSIKILISCRPERHLEDVFNDFAAKLGSSYRIHLGQSAEDKDDIRTFFRVSFDRICQHRRQDGAMSITDGPWPSPEEIEELVDRSSGQFVFAATVIRFVDDETEDPVEMLNLVLERRTSSFGSIDRLYLVILDRVGKKLDQNKKPLELRQLMHNLILHVNHRPSSSPAIADFWFEKEVTINILVKHLQALFVRPTDADSQASQNSIQFRHKSFHDFLARPFAPHSFSLAEMNPVSRCFLSLRMHTREVASRPGVRGSHRSQQLGYAFLYCRDRLPVVFPYEEEARRLHQAYARDPTFRGCICLPRLEPIITESAMNAVRTFTSCGRDDCVINPDLLTLCRMLTMAMSADHFIREWDRRERLRTFSFPILKFLLWLRVMLYSLLSDPSTAFYGTTRALVSRSSRLSWLTRCIAVVNVFFCIMVFLNTRWDVVLIFHLSHTIASFLLNWFLPFEMTLLTPRDSSVATPSLLCYYVFCYVFCYYLIG